VAAALLLGASALAPNAANARQAPFGGSGAVLATVVDGRAEYRSSAPDPKIFAASEAPAERSTVMPAAETTPSAPPPAATAGPQQVNLAGGGFSPSWEGLTYKNVFDLDGIRTVPADSSVAVSQNHVVVVGSSAMRIFDTAGVEQGSEIALSTFFSQNSGPYSDPLLYLVDPRVVYDPLARRFVLIALERRSVSTPGTPLTRSRILLGVSNSEDPTGSWTRAQIDAAENINGFDTVFQDPGLAYDEEAVYITGNMIRVSTDTIFGVRLLIVPKGLGTGGFYDGGAVVASRYNPYATQSFGLGPLAQPARIIGPPPAGATGTWLTGFSNAHDASGNELIAITRIDSPLSTPTFTLSLVSLGDLSDNVVPTTAPQSGTSVEIETGDARTLDAVWQNDSLWTVFAYVPKAGVTANRATAHYVRLDTTNVAGLTVADQRDVGGGDLSTSTWTFDPAISVNQRGDVVIGFSASATSLHPGAYAVSRRASDAPGVISGSQTLHAGTDWYERKLTGTRNLWGHYSSVATAPDTQCFWVYNQYAMTRGNSYQGEDGKWATTVGRACVCKGNEATGDTDLDGICNDLDNCVSSGNFEQQDQDGDGAGDACDACPGNASPGCTAPSADLSITNTNGGRGLTPGTTTTYTITVSNPTAAAVSNVNVTDSFPAALRGCYWTCTASGTGSCQNAFGTGNIASGRDVLDGLGTLTYRATCTVASSASGTIADTANVSYLGDAATANNQATDTDTVGNAADVSLTLTDGITSIDAGSAVNYTIVVTNSAPWAVSPVSVIETLPGIVSGCSWTCSASSGSVCQSASGTTNISKFNNSIAANGGTLTFNQTCTPFSTATGLLTVSATATYSLDSNTANDTASDTDIIRARADLAITKTNGASSANAGSNVTYSIVASNPASVAVGPVAVADSFPASLSGCTWTCAASAGGSCQSASGSGNIATTTNTIAGSNGTLTWSATCGLASTATGSLANTATVTYSNDVVATNNTATDTDSIVPRADLAITNSDGVTVANAGTNVTYTIVASNPATVAIGNVAVTDTFPAPLTSCTWACLASGAGACQSASGSGNIATTTNTIAANGGTLTWTATCSLPATASGTLANTATLSSANDPIPGNNTATDTDQVAPRADLAISKADGVASVNAGGSTTYTIVVTNPATAAVGNVGVTDTFPGLLSSCGWTCAATAGGSCQSASGSGNIATSNNSVGANNGTLTWSVSCNLPAAASGSLVNTATVTYGNDPNAANNTATDTDTIVPRADVAITNTDNVTTANPGANVTYTIVVSNPAAAALGNVAVADLFPASLTACTWICTPANGAGCEAASGSGNIVTTANTLGAGGSTLTFAATCALTPSAAGSLVNTATVSHGNDPYAANNTATDTDAIALPGIMAVAPGTVSVQSDGICSLAEAIHNANADAQVDNGDCPAGNGVDTIALAAGATYTLSQPDPNDGTSGLPAVTSPIILAGHGAIIERGVGQCLLDGNQTAQELRLLRVGLPGSPGDLTLRDLTLRGGCSDGDAAEASGGAIFSNASILALERVVVDGSQSIGSGGGIAASGGGSLSLVDSTLSNNYGAAGAGGLSIGEGVSASIVTSTLAGNRASGPGGGIDNLGTLTFFNSTLSGNTATGGDGGGIRSLGEAEIEYATVTRNVGSDGHTGGVFNGGSMTIKNSLVVANQPGGDCANEGVFTALGHDVDTDGTCAALDRDFARAEFDPSGGLGPLRNNGGATATHEPVYGSPAVDAAPDCTRIDGATAVTVDQRGLARPQDGDAVGGAACDLGAVERTAVAEVKIVAGACTLGDAIQAANTDTTVGGCVDTRPGADVLELHQDTTLGAVDPRSTLQQGARAGLPDVTSEIVLVSDDFVIGRPSSPECENPGDVFRLVNVRAGGALTLVGIGLRDGCAPVGGGVLVLDASLTVFGSTFGENSAWSPTDDDGHGGAIAFADPAAQGSLQSSDFDENGAGSEAGDTGGGAIAVLAAARVDIIDCTFEHNGIESGEAADGGAVEVAAENALAAVTIAGSTFTDNHATGAVVRGGAIAVTGGLASLAGSVFERNTSYGYGASTFGGAVSTDGESAVALSGLVFRDNQALGVLGDSMGGGLHIGGGGGSLTDAYFVGNLAQAREEDPAGSSLGGGLSVIADGPVALANVTFENNRAQGGGGLSQAGGDAMGGGLAVQHGPVTLEQVSFTGNRAIGGGSVSGPGGNALGGGYFTGSAETSEARFLTISGNQAIAGTGGLDSGEPGGGGLAADGPLSLWSSLLEGNTLTAGSLTASADCLDLSGDLNSLGYNTIGDDAAECEFAADGDQVDVGSSLLGLGDHGCTQRLPDGSCLPTMPVRLASPALDQASCNDGTSADARGFSRPWDVPAVANFDDGCDVGAYESRDADNDGVEDGVDNCPLVAHPSQLDADLGLSQPPVAIWRLDDARDTTARDPIGGHDGTLLGDPMWVPGISGAALAFDGAGDSVDIPHAAALDLDGRPDFSVAAWVRLPARQNNTASTTNTIVGKEQPTPTPIPWTLRVYNQSAGANAGRLRAVRSDGTNLAGVDSTVAVNDDSWHHVALVRTAGTLKLYVDGALNASAADNTVGPISNSLAVRIGQRANGTLDLTGAVDEVGLFAGALTDGDVLALYQRKSLAGDGLGAACDCDDADRANGSSACRSAELSITKTDGVTSVVPGSGVTYTLVASNAGPSSSSSSRVTDTFPAALDDCSWTCAGDNGASCTASGEGSIDDEVSLPVASSVTYSVSCLVAPGATDTLTNTAHVMTETGGVVDPTPANATATDSDTLTPQANLSITKTDGVATSTPGLPAIYTITASNAGPSNAPAATVIDTFPPGLTCAWTCVGAGGATCPASGSGNIANAVGLPAGGTVTYTASCAVPSAASGLLTNTATVSPGAGVTDPQLADNTATDVDNLLGQANLAISLNDGVSSAPAGGSTLYTLVASNGGPSDVPAVVTDNFPAALDCIWTCAAASGSSCTAAGTGSIVDTIELAAGSSVVYTASCSISAGATGLLTNIATVAPLGGMTDPVPGNNTASDIDGVVTQADLAISLADGVSTVIAGTELTYVLTAVNGGPSDAFGATLSDAFPPGLACTWTCAAAGGATCSAAGSGNLAETVNLPRSASVTYTATCDVSPAATGALVNTATVANAPGVTDPAPGNNVANDVDSVTRQADVAISKSDGVSMATAGGALTYTIVASNAGPSNAPGTTVTDAFPASLTACTWTCATTGGSTCTAAGSGNLADTVSLPAGGSAIYTADCTVAPAALGNIANTATVTIAGGITDPVAGNNTATDVDTLPSADLAITKTDGVTSATAGGALTYTIVASNLGTYDAPGSTVSDPFPAALNCTWTCAGTAGSACTAAGSGSISDLVSLPAGASVTYTASCGVSPAATGSLTNTATVSGGGVSDPNSANNTATDIDTVRRRADLAVTKTDGLTSVVAGEDVTYAVVAYNGGPSDVTGATVADAFPAGLTGCSWTCIGSGGGACAASGSGGLAQAVDLPVGATLTYTVACTVAPGATGTLTNTATVSAPAGVTDPNASNNVATDVDTVVRHADLSVSKTDGVTTATPGTSLVYSIVVSNAGPSNAPGTTVTDTFPAALTGCTWTCAGTDGGSCAASGSGNLSEVANVPAGGSVTYTASCTVAPDTTASLANTATVAAAAGISDSTTANNAATDTDTLTPQADLAITKTDGVTTAVPGEAVTYTILASNSGPSDAPGTTVTDAFPASLTGCSWTCAGNGGGSCTAAGTGSFVDTASLPAGGSVTYTASCTAAPAATGSLANTATVAAAAGVSDPTAGSNAATDTDTLAPQADLAITKTDGVTTITAGVDLEYTIVVSNAGPSAAAGAIVTDAFPAALVGCAWTCIGAAGGTCTAAGVGDIADIAELPVGASVTYTAGCTAAPTASNLIANTATVTPPAGVADPVPDNDSATDVDTLRAIFTDGFESGDTGPWSGEEPPALRVWMTLPLADEGAVRFTYDLATLASLTELAPSPLAQALDVEGRPAYRVEVRRSAAGAPLELRLGADDGAVFRTGGWTEVAEQRQELRLEWTPSTGTARDGTLAFYLDDRLALWLDGFAGLAQRPVTLVLSRSPSAPPEP
jgi:uncharacterized repeat protein (TIGR01451 family)